MQIHLILWQSLNDLKSSNLDEKILISKVVNPEDAPETMKNWSENPGEILKILVQFSAL